MDFRRLFDLFNYQKDRYPQQAALVHKVNNKWKTFSTDDVINEINRLSAGLLDLGLKKGDKVAIITYIGRPEWNIVDFALQQIGVIVVPIHATCQVADLIYILNNSDAKFCFAGNQDLFAKIHKNLDQINNTLKLFTLDKVANSTHWTDIQTHPLETHEEQFHILRGTIHEDDIATIIYTSGTTGQPKGVMLSHKNIVSNIKSIISLVPINRNKRVLSFLPMSHIFERMVTYTYIAVGATIHYAEHIDKVTENLVEVKPHFFTCVPLLLERMYDRILNESSSSGGFKKRVLNWSLKLGERYESKRSIAYRIQLLIADVLVYRKWRKALGGKVEGVVVGAAALQPKLGKLFSAAGIAIREGYGMTETSPVISFNRFEPGGVRFGTVGIPIPGIDLKIENSNEEGQGEIWVRGPGVMSGYYKNEAATNNVINEEGWFNTGDIGVIVHKRFLEITDRKKDIFKTSSGKYIAPQLIENLLRSSPFVEQCMAVGFNKSHVGALIIPNFEQLKHWCDENNVHWTAPQFMVINPKVVQMMEGIVNAINDKLKREEKIEKIHIHHELWTPESGEITPTLKLKRPFIKEKFKKEIAELFPQ